jgi:hypothetical protein
MGAAQGQLRSGETSQAQPVISTVRPASPTVVTSSAVSW